MPKNKLTFTRLASEEEKEENTLDDGVALLETEPPGPPSLSNTTTDTDAHPISHSHPHIWSYRIVFKYLNYFEVQPKKKS